MLSFYDCYALIFKHHMSQLQICHFKLSIKNTFKKAPKINKSAKL